MMKLIGILLFRLAGMGMLFLLATSPPGSGNQSLSAQAEPVLNSASLLPQDDGTTIRVLVVYTQAAREAAGGVAQIEGMIQDAVALMNTSFSNSTVNAQLVLAGVEEVEYTEKEDLGQVLSDLKEPQQGGLDGVHPLRNQRYADLVNLVVSQGDRCYEGYPLTTEGAAFESMAFSVVRKDCMLADLGFLQALGKNLGAREDWYVDITQTPHTYSHGYIYIDDVTQTGWRTVMTNRLQCNQHGIACEHLPYWSNPQKSYNGRVMGVPEGTNTDCYLGSDAPTPCDADNARILNLNANTVANFRLGAPPPPADILLVNDEGISSPQVETYYTQALQSLGLAYDLQRTGNSGTDEPTLAELAPYSVVVWFTGLSRSASTGPGAPGETALSGWLEQGGCLLLSSQDYPSAHNGQPTTFMQQFLGVLSVSSDSAYTSVTGSGPFTGMGPYILAPPVEYPPSGWNLSDSFQPAPGVFTAFNSSQGSAALFSLSRSYRTAYLGFPLETLPTPADRKDVLQRFLDNCQFWSVFLPMLSRP